MKDKHPGCYIILSQTEFQDLRGSGKKCQISHDIMTTTKKTVAKNLFKDGFE